jgi:Holliday junction DNA helicase RuvA
MYEYLKGDFKSITPTHVVLDVHGVGYFVHISLNCYAQIKSLKEGSLFISFQVREDAHTLYGFWNKEERWLFENLISVSGIGPNTGRMILSSLSSEELHHAIITGNVALLKAIKGIGPKTAQRMILELQDKLKKSGADKGLDTLILGSYSAVQEEASAALIQLGFNKVAVEKCVGNILKESPNMKVEFVVKEALKRL